LLALAGLVLATLPGLPRVDLAPDVFLVVFLPPLLFGAGWRISWGEFVRQLRPIVVLALGLVLFTTVGIGVIAHALDPTLPLAASIVLGAIISPTDPLAASAVARQVLLPRQLITILEGESLANDATGLAVYRVALLAATTGSISVFGGAYTFLVIAVGGIATGLIVAALSVLLQRQVEEPAVLFVIQLLTGYAAYLPAEHVGFSGIFAAAAAGVYCGYHWSYGLEAGGRVRVVAVWETLDFLLNAVLFLLLGLQLPVVLAESGQQSMARLVLTGLAISLAAILLRIGWVFAGELIASRSSPATERPSRGVTALLGWAGMRGVLSLATALAVPHVLASGEPFPGRARILFYAFSVIIVTLVLQGLPLPLVIRWLRVPRDTPHHETERMVRLELARTASRHLDDLEEEGDELTRDLVTEYRSSYSNLVRRLQAESAESAAGRTQEAVLRIRLALARVQRRKLLELYRRHRVDDVVFRRIEKELDVEEQAD
jgi:CPA1 family monovalent cation:H+ antiporter